MKVLVSYKSPASWCWVPCGELVRSPRWTEHDEFSGVDDDMPGYSNMASHGNRLNVLFGQGIEIP